MKMNRIVGAVCALVLALGGCGAPPPPEPSPSPTPDPHAGMVEVPSGFGDTMWVPRREGLAVNPLTAEDFEDGAYIGADYLTRRGVDVSEHQQEIDWAAVKDSGVDFAIIRAGYRGYGEAGRLHADAFFDANMTGALSSGLDVGIYFFSQATGPAEANEEASFLLGLLDDYPPETLALPVFYDWEAIGSEAARTDGMDGETVTACALAFCRHMAAAGYRAGVYAYRQLGYYIYDLGILADYDLWIGAPGPYPDFYYSHPLWQYSFQGEVPGIDGDVDLDLLFLEKAPPETADERSAQTPPP